MVKRYATKRVTSPYGRTFKARYKRIAKDTLPANVTIRRTTQTYNAAYSH